MKHTLSAIPSIPKAFGILLLLNLIACNSPAVSTCIENCVSDKVVNSQMVLDSCTSICTELEYMYGEEALERHNLVQAKEAHEKEFAIKNGREIPAAEVVSVFAEEIRECKETYIAAKALRDEYLSLTKNAPDLRLSDANSLDIPDDCENVRNIIVWSRTNDGEVPLGHSPYGVLRERYTTRNEFLQECIPLEQRYKEIVYSEREELDDHNISREAAEDCMRAPNDPVTRDAMLDSIQEAMTQE